MLDVGVQKPNINLGAIKLSKHAMDRIKERLNIHNEKDALKQIRKVIKDGLYLGRITDEKGNENDAYTYEQLTVYLDSSVNIIATVIIKENRIFNPLRQQFLEISAKELRKVSRQERASKRKLKDYLLDYNVEMAMVVRRERRTRSDRVRIECKERKNELNRRKDELEGRISEIQSDKRKIAASISSLL